MIGMGWDLDRLIKKKGSETNWGEVGVPPEGRAREDDKTYSTVPGGDRAHRLRRYGIEGRNGTVSRSLLQIQSERRDHVESLRRLAAVGCSSISLLQERYSGLALSWQGNARVSPYRAQAPQRIHLPFAKVCCSVSGGTASPTDHGVDSEKRERPGPMTLEEACLGLLARDKGSRQTRPPFEVVPAGDSTAATHVRQRKAKRREPGGWASCDEVALLSPSEAKCSLQRGRGPGTWQTGAEEP
jgi:hypothetical protein